jgi:hypothetical protein
VFDEVWQSISVRAVHCGIVQVEIEDYPASKVDCPAFDKAKELVESLSDRGMFMCLSRVEPIGFQPGDSALELKTLPRIAERYGSISGCSGWANSG